MLFTEEKGMSSSEKDPESWSSIPTYDLPFCLDKTVKKMLFFWITWNKSLVSDRSGKWSSMYW
jgi:hypothetical protein